MNALASIIRPFELFSQDPRRERIGLYTMLCVGLGYSLVSHFLDLLHAPPVPPPFLAIPSDRYFHWAIYFYPPAMLAAWVLASGTLQILARLGGGRGSFEDTLALTGWASGLGTLATLLPDLGLTTLQVAGWMDYGAWRYSTDHGGLWSYITWTYLLLYLVLFLIFYSATLRVVHRLSWGGSLAIGTLVFLVYQGFLILFAR